MTAPPRHEPDWARLAALAGLTAVALYVCYLLLAPFLPAVAWAVALAAIGLPAHRRIRRAVGNENWAAGLSTALVVLVIGVPVVLVAARLGDEAKVAVEKFRGWAADDRWRATASKVPYVGEWLGQLDRGEVDRQVRAAEADLGRWSFGVATGTVWAALQALTAVFVLFFCFRDRHHLLAQVNRLLPLAPADADRVVTRAEDAIHATVYATLVTALVQAVTGGLVFWAVGLPAPVLWGVVMFVLGVLPFVGAFLVWVPAAVALGMDERWGAMAAVVGWGLLMAGLVTNWVYAAAAGGRMKVHPVPSLLAFIGGLAVFGVSGMVIGPCVLAVTVALLDVWRHRLPGAPVASTASSAPAER